MKCLLCSNALWNKTPGTSFHKFPWNPYYRMQWLRAIGYPHFEPSKFDVVCSKHFTPDDIQLVSVTGRIILSKTAVPSLNLRPLASSSLLVNKREQINSQESCRTPDRDELIKVQSNKIRNLDFNSHDNSSTTEKRSRLSPDVSHERSPERIKNGIHPQFEQVMIVGDVVGCAESQEINSNVPASKPTNAPHTRYAIELRSKNTKCINFSSKSESQKDEQQVFGDYVASVLRSIESDLKRKLLKTAIELVIYEHSS